MNIVLFFSYLGFTLEISGRWLTIYSIFGLQFFSDLCSWKNNKKGWKFHWITFGLPCALNLLSINNWERRFTRQDSYLSQTATQSSCSWTAFTVSNIVLLGLTQCRILCLCFVNHGLRLSACQTGNHGFCMVKQLQSVPNKSKYI